MRELRDGLALAAGEWAAGRDVAIARVLSTRGSAYRHAGATMVLTRDGRRAGSVSGGCLEAEVRRRAFWLTEGGKSPVLTFDTAAEADDPQPYAAGCGGAITLMLARCGSPEDAPELALAERVFATSEPGAVAYYRAGDGVERWALHGGQWLGSAPPAPLERDARRIAAAAGSPRGRGNFADASSEWLALATVAPTVLWVFGSGGDVAPVVQMASVLGWDVVVADRAPTAQIERRFPGCRAFGGFDPVGRPEELPVPPPHAACAILTHRYADDLAWLTHLGRVPGRYLGLLGSRKRTAHILSELPPDLRASVEARLCAPIGLDLGGDSPEGIALAIVAQVQAAAHGRDVGGGTPRAERSPSGEWDAPRQTVAACALSGD